LCSHFHFGKFGGDDAIDVYDVDPPFLSVAIFAGHALLLSFAFSFCELQGEK